MPKIEGLQAVIRALKKAEDKLQLKKAQVGGDCVVIGYTQAYAVAVHERPRGTPNPPKSDAQRRAMFAAIRDNEERGHVPWTVGQPKFLEEPARILNDSKEFSRIVITAIRQGRTLMEGLLLAGLRLQRESQLLCPVDTGALKGSAFTRVERLKG